MRNVQLRNSIIGAKAFRGFKTPRIHRVVLNGYRPCTDIFRSVLVGVLCMSTFFTTETQALSVSGRYISASVASSTCIPGANGFCYDSDGSGFVRNFEPHISVGPSVDFRTQIFAFTQRTVPNIFQVLYNNAPCANVYRVFDQCFRSDMQDMPCYGSFMATHAPKKAARSLGAYRLNGCAGSTDARSLMVKHSSFVEKRDVVYGVGSDEHSLNAHIHANNASLFFGFRNFNFMGKDDVPFPFYFLKFRILPRIISNFSGIDNSEKFPPKSNSFFGLIEVPLPHNREYWIFEDSQFPSLIGLGRFVGSANSFTSRTSELGRKAHFPKVGVVGLSQSVGVQFLRFENNFRQPINGFQPNSDKIVGFCASSNFKLDCSYCFHYNRKYHQRKTMSTELRKDQHSVSQLMVHLVFVVKYRHSVISDTVWDRLQYGFNVAAKRLGITIVETNHAQPHVHLVVKYPPKISVSDLVNALKGNSSIVVRRDCKEELRKKLWGSAFWTPSFFAASCGGAPIEVLKQYVQFQQTKAALKGGVSTQRS